MTDSFDEDNAQAQDPSKSERKRQMHALQAMGERLVALPQSDLNLITISDERLSDAIALARRITARSGLKRQLQYIGKLMRSVDATEIWITATPAQRLNFTESKQRETSSSNREMPH
jgi:ribosome-associated protein